MTLKANQRLEQINTISGFGKYFGLFVIILIPILVLILFINTKEKERVVVDKNFKVRVETVIQSPYPDKESLINSLANNLDNVQGLDSYKIGVSKEHIDQIPEEKSYYKIKKISGENQLESSYFSLGNDYFIRATSRVRDGSILNITLINNKDLFNQFIKFDTLQQDLSLSIENKSPNMTLYKDIEELIYKNVELKN